MKDLKFIDTPKLIVYSEIINKMLTDTDIVGQQITIGCNYEALTEKERDEIHKDLLKVIADLEPKLHAILKEIDKRMKKDLGVVRGTYDLSKYLDGFKKKYEDAFIGESAFKMKKAEEDAKKNPKMAIVSEPNKIVSKVLKEKTVKKSTKK